MKQAKILWVDDEIEILKPHILFLEQKGYSVKALNNGMDAIELIDNERFDIVFFTYIIELCAFIGCKYRGAYPVGL